MRAGHAQPGLGRDPGRVLADEPDVEAPAGEQQVADLVPRRPASSRYAPARLRCRSRVGAAASVTISTDSLVHRIELSKLLLSTIRLAAFGQVGGGVHQHRHVAGADPDGGVAGAVARPGPPATPPVATMTLVRSSVISALISGTDGSSTTWMTPSGAPAATAAAASARAASAQHSRASGCGLTTTALRVIRASSALKNTVATGLVDGVSASTTPAGRGISTILAAGSTRGVT